MGEHSSCGMHGKVTSLFPSGLEAEGKLCCAFQIS